MFWLFCLDEKENVIFLFGEKERGLVGSGEEIGRVGVIVLMLVGFKVR